MLLGASRATCYRAVKSGNFPLPVWRIGGRLRVPRKAIERLLDGLDPMPAVTTAPPVPWDPSPRFSGKAWSL